MESEVKEAGLRLVETIGQFQDAIYRDRLDIRTIRSLRPASLDRVIGQCFRYYGKPPRDGALLGCIGTVAHHQDRLLYLVRRMTLEAFSEAIDDAFRANPRYAEQYVGMPRGVRGWIYYGLSNAVISAGDWPIIGRMLWWAFVKCGRFT